MMMFSNFTILGAAVTISVAFFSGAAQDSPNKLAPELSNLEWMIGDWKIDELRVHAATVSEDYFVQHYRPMEISVADDGQLLFIYRYYVYAKGPDGKSLGPAVQTIQRTEKIGIRDGRLVVNGLIETDESGQKTLQRFRLSVRGDRSSLYIQGADIDRMRHLSFGVSLAARKVHIRGRIQPR